MAKQLRIAEVLSTTDILINAGQDAGIEHGNRFVVYDEGPEIFDPETNESLGHLEIKKGQFEAIDVQPRATIARLKSRKMTKLRPRQLFDPRRMFYEEYEVDVSDEVRMEVSEPSYSEKLVIKKNDLVRMVQE